MEIRCGGLLAQTCRPGMLELIVIGYLGIFTAYELVGFIYYRFVLREKSF